MGVLFAQNVVVIEELIEEREREQKNILEMTLFFQGESESERVPRINKKIREHVNQEHSFVL